MEPFWPANSMLKALLFKWLREIVHALHEHTTRLAGIVVGRSEIAA
jgi:hypothetical protein